MSVFIMKHNRMLVGLRRNGHTRVWYEPSGKQDFEPGHAPAVALYSQATGAAGEEEPMFGEVSWLPMFQHDHFESTAKYERLELQRRLLFISWCYLVAKDRDEITKIEEHLEAGGPRMQSVLRGARAGKRQKLRARERRRLKKMMARRNGDLPVKSVEVSSSSDDDSGFEDDSGSDMPPPPRPNPLRRTMNMRRGGKFQSPTTDRFLMSGVRGSSRGRAPNGRANTTVSFTDSRNESEDFEPEPIGTTPDPEASENGTERAGSEVHGNHEGRKRTCEPSIADRQFKRSQSDTTGQTQGRTAAGAIPTPASTGRARRASAQPVSGDWSFQILEDEEARRRRMEEYNGSAENEDKIHQEAMRQSEGIVPENARREQADIQEAMRRSVSIEID